MLNINGIKLFHIQTNIKMAFEKYTLLSVFITLQVILLLIMTVLIKYLMLMNSENHRSQCIKGKKFYRRICKIQTMFSS